jgi:Dioxygenase
MAPTTRRRFLELGLALPAALTLARRVRAGGQGLDRFGIGDPGCSDARTPTPAIPDTPGYRPDAPARASLVAAKTVGATLTLTGSVIGLKCGSVKGARVDLWQADAAGANAGTSDGLRGRQMTDAQGHYRFVTVVPGASGRRAPHLNVRVEPPGHPALVTQLFFPGDPRNAHDPFFRPELIVKTSGPSGDQSAVFDFILDL